MRIRSTTLAACALLAACTAPRAPQATFDASAPWRTAAAPAPGSTCARQLDAVRDELARLPTTALMVVHHGQVSFTYGDIARPSIVYSVRKSLLAMLYGKPVADGRIALDATLAQLGIDDVGGLLPIERQATVRDLLTARSGVYHAAVNGGDNSADAPPRGSRAPGTWFLYNNWDFNAAGDVFEQQAGKKIYQAFDEEIARPLGMQDYDAARERRAGDPAISQHLAYHFHLSARDMARVGQLMLQQGRWNDRQVIARDWAAMITTPVTQAADMHPEHTARRQIDYGMLWWMPEEPAGSPLAGASMAWGYYGQFILVVPARDMVIVHKRDLRAADGAQPHPVGPSAFLHLAAELAQAACD